MITNLTAPGHNSIVSEWLADIRDRDIQQDRLRFRRNIERIGEVIAYEISKTLYYDKIAIETPISKAIVSVLSNEPVVATILRAGIPLYQGIMNVFDNSDCAFIGSYRQHTGDKIGISQEYVSMPSIAGKPLIIADPMLATGASLIEAIKAMISKEIPSEIHIACVIASPIGIGNILKYNSKINIWTAAIDLGLNENGYIIPGLGDAGDLCFGSKI